MRASRNRWFAKTPDSMADWGSYVALPILIGVAAVVFIASSKRRRNAKREFRQKLPDDFPTEQLSPRPLRQIESFPATPVVVQTPPVVPVRLPEREAPTVPRAGYWLTIAALLLVGTAAIAFAAIYRFRPMPHPANEQAVAYSAETPTPALLVASTRPPFIEPPSATPQNVASVAAMLSPTPSPSPSATAPEQTKARHRKIHRRRSNRARSLNEVLERLF